MPYVIVVGSANYDLTVRLERLPAPGETVTGGEIYASFGGKGANQAVGARRAGAEVSFIARVGQDEHGEAIVRNLLHCGLDTDGVVRDNDRPSGTALIMVDWQGRNMIAVAPGSNAYLTADDVRGMERRIAQARTVLVQLEIPIQTVAATLAMAKAHGLRTILDPAPARPLPNEILRLVDILTPNEVEAELLTGYAAGDEEGAGRAARDLLDRGCGEVLVTLGARGVLWAHPDGVELFPPLPVVAVDSTAAGDSFNGALGCALAEGRAMREAIRFASAAGALAVTHRGAQTSLPTREEIERLLAQHTSS